MKSNYKKEPTGKTGEKTRILGRKILVSRLKSRKVTLKKLKVQTTLSEGIRKEVNMKNIFLI